MKNRACRRLREVVDRDVLPVPEMEADGGEQA
jgi:hypothetical protein